MRRTSTEMKLRWVVGVALLALAGCERPAPPGDTPTPGVPEPATPVPAAPAGDASATVTPSAQAQPTPVASSTATTVVEGAAGVEPAIASMKLAEPPHKIGAPVDLRYQFEGDVKTGQPVTLHLAAVPRVAGSNLVMSVKKESGISTTGSELTAQKASASTVYRQQLSVTKLAGGASELHVLVMMEVPEGSAHSWFSIPLDGAPVAGKQQSIKLE